MEDSRQNPIRVGQTAILIAAMILFVWIALSVAISVTYNLWNAKTRVDYIPEGKIVHIETQAEALKALRAVRVFHDQLLASSRRFFKRFRSSPERSIELWRRWEKDWKRDFASFGHGYSFSKPNDKQGKFDSTLLKAYIEVSELNLEISEQFESLYGISMKEKSEMDKIYNLYRDEIVNIEAR